jgi:23S rRNA maturation-related 3'-5' exoribonuclease YhaM
MYNIVTSNAYGVIKMVAITINHNSTQRTKKHRENMIRQGFKRVQKWVFDIENATIQEQLKKDLANYKPTKDDTLLNEFALSQLQNIEGWE